MAWFLTMPKRRVVIRILFGVLLGVVMISILVYAGIFAVTKTFFDPIRFVKDSTYFRVWTGSYGSGGSELKFIDPIALTVVAEAVLPDRCSVARMSLTSVLNKQTGMSEDALVLLGDELAFQYRWRPQSKSIHFHEGWTRRYRSNVGWVSDGTFQATGAATYDEIAYYTDNTFPVHLHGKSYRMFRMPLNIDELDSKGQPKDITVRNNNYDTQKAIAEEYIARVWQSAPAVEGVVHLTSDPQFPGFMFWSVVVSPLLRHIIVWDTAGRTVQARSLDDLSVQWELKAWQADCLTVAADRGHVYLSDYNMGTPVVNEWLSQLSKFSKFNNLSKFFIVADTRSGKVIANVTIEENAPVRLSMIIPGQNGDVFIGTSTGLVRVYV